MTEFGLQAKSPLGSSADMSNPPICGRTLLDQCMGSESLALMLLTELESSVQDTVQSIVHSIREKDLTKAQEAAHSLKGAAGIIGAESLREIAANLESAGKEGQILAMEEWSERLQIEMQRCLEYIPQLRQGIAPSTKAEVPELL